MKKVKSDKSVHTKGTYIRFSVSNDPLSIQIFKIKVKTETHLTTHTHRRNIFQVEKKGGSQSLLCARGDQSEMVNQSRRT